MTSTFHLNQKRFWVAIISGLAGLSILIGSLFATGKVFAAFPLTGIGGYEVAMSGIDAKGFKLYPAIGETSEKAKWPQAAVELSEATIKGLVITKGINVSDSLGAYGIHTIDVVISATGDVTGKGFLLNVTNIDADIANFKELEVSEKFKQNPIETFGLNAPNMKLTDAALNTHSMFINSIQLPGLNVTVVPHDKNGNVVGGK
ncbi:DUF6230 family protein [Alkalihalobacterium elongatum]|uniref:DUF6230 family protein n=1 Tax=Alkalihalobacterium elongatum TaxID=2675466 RepID=UPI001C1F6ECB|nr:DUF6230 family protein [Alkalihalobacterium elongatum]